MAPKVSAAFSLRHRGDVSALLPKIKAAEQAAAKDSVRLSVRGSSSAIISLLKSMDDAVGEVSALISIRGNKSVASKG